MSAVVARTAYRVVQESLTNVRKHAPDATVELTVRYVRPVPLETPLAGRAQLVADRERYADVEGRIEDLATAAVLATARGRFVFMRG